MFTSVPTSTAKLSEMRRAMAMFLLIAGRTIGLETRYNPGARFTQYVTTVLRLSYENAEVTKHLTKNARYDSFAKS